MVDFWYNYKCDSPNSTSTILGKVHLYRVHTDGGEPGEPTHDRYCTYLPGASQSAQSRTIKIHIQMQNKISWSLDPSDWAR